MLPPPNTAATAMLTAASLVHLLPVESSLRANSVRSFIADLVQTSMLAMAIGAAGLISLSSMPLRSLVT